MFLLQYWHKCCSYKIKSVLCILFLWHPSKHILLLIAVEKGFFVLFYSVPKMETYIVKISHCQCLALYTFKRFFLNNFLTSEPFLKNEKWKALILEGFLHHHIRFDCTIYRIFRPPCVFRRGKVGWDACLAWK